MILLIIKLAAGAIAIYLGIALALIASQRPPAGPPAIGEGLEFSSALDVDAVDLRPLQAFPARDGTALFYRRYDSASPSPRIVILVHGSAWHGMQFHQMAKYLSERGLGTVILPDMRGHGFTPAQRGDIDHIGQLEQDMADLIDHVGAGIDGPQIVLGGHSSGGGFAVRFAGGQYGHKADAFMLMAPFLKHNAPTTRPNAGGWARPAVRRIIGLTMLNAVGIRLLNHLAVISFAMPRPVLEGTYGRTATTQYSFALNQSFAPRSDYGADLAAIRQPLLVLAGGDDEAFVADGYEPVISAHAAGGTYHVLPGVNHLGIVSDRRAMETAGDWLSKLRNS